MQARVKSAVTLSLDRNFMRRGSPMKPLTLKLPKGAVQRGRLYRDHGVNYGLGDVLEVELATGFTIDLGWCKDKPETPFRLVVYREYFGDHSVDYYVATPDDAAQAVEFLAERYSSLITYSSCSESELSYAPRESIFDGRKSIAACSNNNYFNISV